MTSGSHPAKDNSKAVLAAFFKLLREKQPTEQAARLFLAALRGLPPDPVRAMPVLTDLARLRALSPTPATEAPAAQLSAEPAKPQALSPTPPTEGGVIRRRLERRYTRICFVQEELGRLDFTQAQAGENLEDFVFRRMDFSFYKKIGEGDFGSLFIEGLEDFGPGFFERAFNHGQRTVRAIIEGCYQKTGAFYHIRRENPLILSIMRTLHASLEFAPLFSFDEILGECTALVRFLESQSLIDPGASQNLRGSLTGFFPCLLLALDGTEIPQRDGRTASLRTAPGERREQAGSAGKAPLVLQGIFRPLGKAYTIPLVTIPEKKSP